MSKEGKQKEGEGGRKKGKRKRGEGKKAFHKKIIHVLQVTFALVTNQQYILSSNTNREGECVIILIFNKLVWVGCPYLNLQYNR